MRLLVTRPADQAERTAQKLRALGHEPVFAPVLDIAPTGANPPPGAYDFVLATSAQAFSGVDFPTALLNLPFACVGEKTAAAARIVGFRVLRAAPDSDALAAFLLGEKQPNSVLYLAGRERRADLEDRLRAADWRVEIVETYAARPVVSWPEDILAALKAGGIDGALHYSPRSAGLALALIGSEVARGLWHFCLSPAIAAVCRDWAPDDRVVSASRPDEEALIALLHAQDSHSQDPHSGAWP
jgi:uroporphyrinogen-III synthase